MPLAPVPEAAMDQDHGVRIHQRQINSNSSDSLMGAVVDAVPTKGRAQHPFRDGVTAADSGHYVATFGRGTDVRHELTRAVDTLSHCY